MSRDGRPNCYHARAYLARLEGMRAQGFNWCPECKQYVGAVANVATHERNA